ncbi:transposase [Streptomyces sp. NPDC001663]|uniref:transposase n=1 Tax=Streptomyces sp. NPDC001663 TaxID=3364597 RepID=UPI003674327C
MTDAQRARIEPLLPDRTPKRGGQWRDHRQVIDAIAGKFRTGSPRDSKRLASAQLVLLADAWRQFREFAAR